MSAPMEHRDIFIRLVDPTGRNKPVVNHHRVWDPQRFLQNQIEQYDGAKVKPGDRRTVHVATREQYEAYRKGGAA